MISIDPATIQSILSWFWAPLSFMLGWIGKILFAQRRELNEFKLHVAENYVSHKDLSEMKKDIREIKNYLLNKH